MKRIVLALAVVALVCASPRAAHAATACFDWQCTTAGFCTINAGCSSASPFIWKWDFNFGDGVDTGLTGNSVQTHQYGSSVYDSVVTLRILYWSDPGQNTVSCRINTRLPPVGPQPPPSYFQGRCTQ